MPLEPRELELLQRELVRWVEEGLVTADQAERILARYTEQSAGSRPPAPDQDAAEQDAPAQDAVAQDQRPTPHPAGAAPAAAPATADQAPRRVVHWMPVVLMAMAVVLVGAGLILFYAANWRKMSAATKLVQVFGVIITSYGGSYAFLFSKRPLPVAGRGLMLLGMLAYGAAIGLIAQIFHISAHPSSGVLAWMLGVLALSLVMQERMGYYLAAVLALVWTCWEGAVYGNPNYPFVAVPLVLFVAFYRKSDHAGMILAALELLLYFYQVNIHHLTQWEGGGAAFVLLHLSLGAALVGQQRLVQNPRLRVVSAVGGVLGWLLLFAPLIGLSWPMDLGTRWPLLSARHWPLTLQHLALLGLTAVQLALMRRRGEPVGLLGLCLGLGLALMLLPLGERTVLVVSTHLALLALLLGALLHSHRAAADTALERVMATLLYLLTLGVKGIGLFTMAVIHRSYYVAYSLGFVVLATVLLLMALYVDALAVAPRPGGPTRQRPYLWALGGGAGGAIFLMIYAVSFRVPEQATLLRVDPVVLTLLGLLVLLALGFYALLWRRGAHRLALALSAVVFLVALAILLLAGPGVSWPVYSVAFNLLLLLMAGVLLYASTRINSVLLVNLAIAGFALQVTTRYFDLFWDLLSGSLLFIITGVVLFGGGVLLELNRRKVVQLIRDADDDHAAEERAR